MAGERRQNGAEGARGAPAAASAGASRDPEELSRLHNLELIARVVVDGVLRGVHRSRHRGSSIEFAENRPYAPGDQIARIDWRAYGKTDRLYLREYEDETNLRLTLLVDASASMGSAGPVGTGGSRGSRGSARGGTGKLRYASCLAAALGHLAVRQLDAVGLVLFDEEIRRLVPPRASRLHLRGLLAELERAVPAGRTRLAPVLERIVEALPPRGFVALFSDLIDDPRAVLRSLARFRAAGFEVAVFHIIEPAEREFPFSAWTVFEDPESPGRPLKVDASWARETYLENLESHLREIREACRAGHIDHQLVDTRTPFDVALTRFLTARRRHGVR